MSNIYTEIHEALCKELLARIKSGGATAADLSVARNLLRDNNVSVADPNRNTNLKNLANVLPFGEDEGEEGNGQEAAAQS